MRKAQSRSGIAPWVVVLSMACASCGSSGSGSVADALIDAGVDLDALFAPPTDAELAALDTGWRALDLSPNDVREELVRVQDGGDTVRVLSHLVDGQRHYGVVIEPPGSPEPGSIPVVTNFIGFGRDMTLVVPSDATAIGGEYVTVLPSFRGHTLQVGNQFWFSEGNAYDQCDGGTDDALAFLEVVLAMTPAADPERVALLGGSRGGNVAMMASVRRSGVDAVVNIAGPTDYLREEFLDHPNFTRLYSEYFVADLLDGGTIEEARARMLSCSPLYFAEELPPLQAHHGTADQNVPFEQAEILADRMDALGRTTPAYELFVYEGSDHELAGVLDEIGRRVDDFVESRL